MDRKPPILSSFVEQGWNFYARFYDSAHPAVIKMFKAFGDLSYDEFEEEFVETANLKQGSSVLDVACGTGASHYALSEAVGPKGEIVAVDISEEMLNKAIDKAEALNIENIRFDKTDAEELSLLFDEESFDAVLSCNGLPNFLHPEKALIEMAYVLRPAGSLTLCTISREKFEDTPFNWITPQFRKKRIPYQEEWEERLEELGFEEIEFQEIGIMLIMTAKKQAEKKTRPKKPSKSRSRKKKTTKTTKAET